MKKVSKKKKISSLKEKEASNIFGGRNYDLKTVTVTPPDKMV